MTNTLLINIHTHKLSVSDEIIILNIPIGFENLSEQRFPNQHINTSPNLQILKSAGIHPWQIENIDISEQLSILEQMIQAKQIIAIGEIGLDKACKTNFEKQIEVFRLQLNLTMKYKLPIIIHCVRAYNEVFEILTEYKHSIKAVFHGFNSSKEMALQLCSKNYYLSIGSSLLNLKSKIWNYIGQIPLENLFFETDESEISIQELYKKYCKISMFKEIELRKKIKENFDFLFLKQL
ncbi:MAG: TatD family hydrolase [Bacteroidota bacterium]